MGRLVAGDDAHPDIAWLREHVTADTIAGVIAPYRALFNAEFADPDAQAEAAATVSVPPIPPCTCTAPTTGRSGRN